MSGAVEGLPPPRAAHTLVDDPRGWPQFVRHTLVEGKVVPDTLIAAGGGGSTFQRPPSEFCGTVVPPGTPDAKHVAEAGRYHLFVSGVCPWATGVRAARHILGLDEVVSMDVADGQSGAGWVMLTGTSCPPWHERQGPFFLHEVYQASEPDVTTRITVPILWDKKLGCIVSNDSWAIIKMLSTAFRSLASKETPCVPDLAPEHLATKMEETQAALYDSLLNGVYKAGINLLKKNTGAADEAAAKVYATLDQLEEQLSERRFLLGGAEPTAVDIRLFMTLVRYDAAYRQGFALRGGRGGILVGDAAEANGKEEPGYPVLGAYVRDMYARVKAAMDWSYFRQYYRWAPVIAADQPLPDLARIAASADATHGREALP